MARPNRHTYHVFAGFLDVGFESVLEDEGFALKDFPFLPFVNRSLIHPGMSTHFVSIPFWLFALERSPSDTPKWSKDKERTEPSSS